MGAGHKKIALGVCGSIAAYKAGDLIRQLREHGCDVRVVMTQQAQEFITPLTLSTLAGSEAIADFNCADAWKMEHIALAKETDVLLIAPATANMIAKCAHGLCDDLLSALFLSYTKPVIIAPAMNDDMYSNPLVVANCTKLKKHGVRFVEPIKGKLACGTVGVGHLADIEDIVKAVIRN